MDSKTFNYQDIKASYKETDYFDVLELKIKIKINDPGKGSNASYHLLGLEINDDNYSKKDSKVTHVKNRIKDLNEKITTYRANQKKEWNLFYLYKEIFQILSDDFNYYRGQATDWDMLPGVLRSNTNDSYIKNFEVIYQEIMYKYPDIIRYIPPVIDREKLISREQELAHLQHYGLQSSLIDITENPFIALLFMVSETSSNSFENGVVEAFSININDHNSNNLFSRVKLLETNKRIIAQKGAFLNFEKVVLNNLATKVVKIPLVRIKLDYTFKELDDKENLSNELREEKSELKKLVNDLEKSKSNMDNLSKDLKIEEKPSMYFKKMQELWDKMQELDELKLEIRTLKEFRGEIFLQSIRNQINKKLEEYHYVENLEFQV